MPDQMPIIGKYSVIEIQKFSDSGNIQLPIDIRFISFFPDKIILEGNKNSEYQVLNVVLNETEGRNFYYIITNDELFLLVLNQEEQFRTSMPHLAKLTTDDGREGIMYSLHNGMFPESQ